jgi:hypothetical protein
VLLREFWVTGNRNTNNIKLSEEVLAKVNYPWQGMVAQASRTTVTCSLSTHISVSTYIHTFSHTSVYARGHEYRKFRVNFKSAAILSSSTKFVALRSYLILFTKLEVYVWRQRKLRGRVLISTDAE